MSQVAQHSEKAGLPPGSLVQVGELKSSETKIRAIIYNDQTFEEIESPSLSALKRFCEPTCKVWINVTGLADIAAIESIGHYFGLDHLVLEDILNTEHTPKMEDLGEFLFIVMKMMNQCEPDNTECDQISMVVFPHLVITFLERDSPLLQPIYERIRFGKIRIRKMGADYLAYTIIDAVVDHYFVILDRIGEQIENLEEREFDKPSQETFREILELRRRLIDLRKSVWPLREVIAGLQNETDIVHEDTLRYIKDIYDHTIQIIETIESFRDILSGVMDLYLTVMSNRMNEAMKNLTIIATIFMPLTLISGIYGMNFDFMPELHWKWGYPSVLLSMAVMTVGMLFYFRKKRWL